MDATLMGDLSLMFCESVAGAMSVRSANSFELNPLRSTTSFRRLVMAGRSIKSVIGHHFRSLYWVSRFSNPQILYYKYIDLEFDILICLG